MTKRAMIEAIMRIIKGGDPRSSTQLKEADVSAAIGRALNQLLKTEAITMTDPFGTSVLSHHLMAAYTSVPVVDTACNRSKAVLPAMPISLPMNRGIWQVTKAGCYEFIVPLEPGMMAMATNVSHTALSAVLNSDMIAYEPTGNEIHFNRPASEVGPVDIKLLLVDIAQLDEYAQLPIPADMEAPVVDAVLKELQFRPHDTAADGNDSP